jgi:hypothetical protein
MSVRLTLRTLLAYLDDILEPAQTKEIGTKLAESKFASDLVQRIREVMRRRRLSAPEVGGGELGLDPNVMAEYLDNTLAPEKVTDVEKRCLEFDMLLAEAAACHQILTLVLGEPVEIAPESRRRMYGLVSQGSGDNQAAVAASEPATAAKEEAMDSDILVGQPRLKEQSEAMGSELPDYLKPRPFWLRALVTSVIIALPLLLILLIATDQTSNFGMGRTVAWLGHLIGWNRAAETEPGGPPAVAQNPKPRVPGTNRKPVIGKVAAKPNEDALDTETVDDFGLPGELPISAGKSASKKTNETPTEPPAPAVAQAPPTTKKTASTENATPAPPLPGLAVPGAATTPTETSPSPVGPAPVVAVPPQAGPPAPVSVAATTTGSTAAMPEKKVKPGSPSAVNASPHEPEASTEPPPEVRVLGNAGVLLGYDQAREDWFMVERPGLTLPKPKDVAPEAANGPAGKIQTPAPPAPATDQRRPDHLAVPEPFDSTLEFGDGLCRMSLLGGTSIVILAPHDAARVGVTLNEGRVVLRSGGSAMPGTPYKPLLVNVKVRDEVWQLEFLRPETVCGLEIISGFPVRPGEDAKDTSYLGALYVVSGEIRFIETAGRQRTLEAGRWISLAPSDRANVTTDLSGFAFRTGGGTILAWLKPETHRLPAALVRVARDFEKEFNPDQPVSLSLGTVAKNDPNPKIAELAVKALALLGQYQPLAEVLAQVPHDEAVQAAANGLRAWLPMGPDRAGLLQKELKLVFVSGPREMGSDMDDTDVIMRLLWGYGPDDARERATANQLVSWLGHDKLAVRVLAIDQIAHLTGQTLHYRAGMPTSQRNSHKREWEQYVERNKGLLPP